MATKPDRNYDTRPGYDPNFVGFKAPLPKLSKSAAKEAVALPVTKKGQNKHELKYHHYSVIMNAARKIAFVAAVNFDGKARAKFKRSGPDKWFSDPRVEKDVQTTNAFYARNPLDRGHLVRRADAAWGATKEEAERANIDTFHFTNCSPQHEIFNQQAQANKRNLKLWGNLEEHISQQVENQRLSIFNGPIFRPDDREHRKIKVPKQFFKIVIAKKDDGTPAAYGFLLSQEPFIRDLGLEGIGLEGFDPGPFKVFQVPISEIEQKTKLDFGPIREFDTKRRRRGEEGLEAVEPEPVLIESLDQIEL